MSFTLPACRRDKEVRLGVLMRNILWLDAKGGCVAENEFFAHHPTMGLNRDVATIRRALADLEACGLIVREFDSFGRRTIRPLVTAVELIEAGWAALAEAILGMTQWPAVVRALCRSLLMRLGKWRKELDLGRLGVRSEHQNCAGSARRIARPSPSKESEAQKTTTVRGASSEPKPEDVVVSPAEVSEPESEAVAVAIDAGLTVHAARRAVGEKPLDAVRNAIRAAKAYATTHEVRSLPALLFTAIRAGWLAPAPPSSHPSDLGERPQRVVKARREIPADWLPGIEYEAARGFCNVAMEKLRALGDTNPSSGEIRDMARLLWQRQHPTQTPPWAATPAPGGSPAAGGSPPAPGASAGC